MDTFVAFLLIVAIIILVIIVAAFVHHRTPPPVANDLVGNAHAAMNIAGHPQVPLPSANSAVSGTRQTIVLPDGRVSIAARDSYGPPQTMLPPPTPSVVVYQLTEEQLARLIAPRDVSAPVPPNP